MPGVETVSLYAVFVSRHERVTPLNVLTRSANDTGFSGFTCYRPLGSLTSSTTSPPNLRRHTLILGSVLSDLGCHRVSQLSRTLAPFPLPIDPDSLEADM